ncbi:unnamed protein product [Linum trigynum]|uniref:Gag-pol polyprotein n=1 Tax=Linum trigynum TaxID=586398 RepID=A0AAV2FQT6_9ROSI
MRDHRKHCDFHREAGHLKEDCVNLRVEIEALIRRGFLSECVRGAKEQKEQDARPPPPPQLDYNEITGSYIVRKEICAVTIEGDQPKKKTKHDRAMECATIDAQPKCNMSFDDAEFPQGIPSKDPLTITALIVACKFYRLLINGGSDIMFKSTLDQMDIDPHMIKHAQGNLVGFSRTRVAVIGAITLPVVIGDQEPRVSKQVDFTIVDNNSPHNGILGRAFLAKFMALPSTCH